MLLAEALIEKNYINESINSVCNTIRSLSTVYNKNDVKFNKEQLKDKFIELEQLYTKYQQFSIMISRAKSIATVAINETEISLKDAMVIRDIMSSKLSRFLSFFRIDIKGKTEEVVCIDERDLEEMVKVLRADIKTLDIKIQNKLWNIEVK